MYIVAWWLFFCFHKFINGLDLLRLAILRRVYTDNHMAVIAAALKNVFDRRQQITHGVRIAWETPLMRHFTVQLERIQD